MEEKNHVIDAFHKLYYESHVWEWTTWLGVPTLKCPFDLWIYQEILTERRPDVIIETGTARGGSALFLAFVWDNLNTGHIMTIDREVHAHCPKHERITYVTGSSIAQEIVEAVQSRIKPGDTVMVILDADHSAPHVLEELRLYSPLVTSGQYLIVEDTNVNGNPVLKEFGPGPREVVEEFLREHREFSVDHAKEKFGMTFSRGGYLLRET